MSSPSSPLRIVFAGTPVFAAESLRALLQNGHDVVAVYTQPDRPTGRGRKLEAGPVKALAQALASSGLAPERLELEVTESIFLADDDITDQMFKSLKILGVRLALDDFGTGGRV